MITPELLSVLAGRTNTAKGLILYDQGKVTVASKNDNQISAQVAGTQSYRVSISHLNTPQIKFSCTCPAFEYQAVCKHCVAVGFAAIALNKGEALPEPAPVKGSKSKPSGKTNNNDEILKAYLASLPKSQLENELYQLISYDRNQYKNWVAKAKLASEPVSIKHLQKQVTKALPLKSLWDYNKVFLYFEQAESLFSDILLSAQQLDADEQLALVSSVHKRLDKVLEKLDDSAGYRYGLLAQLNKAIDFALSQKQLDPQAKANWLLDTLQTPNDYMPSIPEDFTLTEQEMSVFLAKCMVKFDEFPVESNILARNYHPLLFSLAKILNDNLPDDTQLSTRIKINEKVASSCGDLIKISELCLQHNDEFLAEDWLLRAKPLLTNVEEQKSWNNIAIKVYGALDQPQKAWDIAWQAFWEKPLYQNWLVLQEKAAQIGWQTPNYQQEAEKRLVSVIEQSDHRHYFEDDIPRFYLNTQQPEKAIAHLDQTINTAPADTIKKHTDKSIFGEAAIQLSQSHAERAFAYSRVYLSNLLLFTGNQRYEDCISHLQKLKAYLPKTDGNTHEFAAIVSELTAKYGKRKKLLGMLHAAFG